VFEGEPGEWWLDGRRIGRGPRLHWTPQPGRHRLVLRRGAVTLATAQFEVRGAVLRSTAAAGLPVRARVP